MMDNDMRDMVKTLCQVAAVAVFAGFSFAVGVVAMNWLMEVAR